MSGNHRRGDSAVGTAMHVEKIYLPAEDTVQKSKRKCVYYEHETKDCVLSRIKCVGPSNMLCKHYSETVCKPRYLKENVFVYDSNVGVGMVMRISDVNFYVQYEKYEGLKRYFIKDIKKFDDGVIYI